MVKETYGDKGCWEVEHGYDSNDAHHNRLLLQVLIQLFCSLSCLPLQVLQYLPEYKHENEMFTKINTHQLLAIANYVFEQFRASDVHFKVPNDLVDWAQKVLQGFRGLFLQWKVFVGRQPDIEFVQRCDHRDIGLEYHCRLARFVLPVLDVLNIAWLVSRVSGPKALLSIHSHGALFMFRK